MHLAQRDVGRLIFSEQPFFVAVGDFGRTANDHPMFGAMAVLLQAEACTGLNLCALDFEAYAFVDAVVPDPGAVDSAVQDVLFVLLLLKGVDDVLDVLAARPISATSMASVVSTATKFWTPTKAIRRVAACTMVLRLSLASTSPIWAFPC